MLQVRNLPDDVHAKLKQRAREAGMSLSEYVAGQLAELVRYRSNAEILEDVRRRAIASGLPDRMREAGLDAVTVVHEARAERDDELFGPGGPFDPDGPLGHR